MVRILRELAHKYFSDDEAVILFLFLLGGVLAVIFFGAMLAPVIAAVIIAFILQGVVSKLVGWGVPELPSILCVFVVFLGALAGLLFGLLPLIWTQVTALAVEAPRIIRETRAYLELLPEQYPALISMDVVNNIYFQLTAEAGRLTQWLVSVSISSIPDLLALLIYLILVPILVFFFLKDRSALLSGMARLLPEERPLLVSIWGEINRQCANYVRGKALEILIVGVVTYVTFKLLGMPYSVLLALIVGLSVLVPYVGATVATVPVAVIALSAFGWGPEFMWVMVAYAVIQALDGNVLVPVLFAEVNNLSPVAIIVAVLFFGGIWGLWGVFFSIPLATMVKAVFSAWPVHHIGERDEVKLND